MQRRNLFQLSLGTLLGAACLAPVASAQPAAYPDHAVKVVVPFAPGGGLDVVARLLSDQLSRSMGQPFVVENRPGASGNIGTEAVARAPSDGYTLLLGGSSHTVNQSLFKNLPFDAKRDFTPISRVADSTQVLLVHESVPATSVQELIALAKAKPGSLNYGSAGVGAPSHIAGEVFKHLAGIDLTHIPYKGAGQATNDLLGGQIQVLFSSLPSAVPHFEGGKIRPLAVSSAERFPAAPQLPTMQEAGVADYRVDTWFGLFAPAGLDPAVRDKLAEAVAMALRQPQLQETLAKQGMIAIGNAPADFERQLAEEYAFWPGFIQAAGITVD